MRGADVLVVSCVRSFRGLTLDQLRSVLHSNWCGMELIAEADDVNYRRNFALAWNLSKVIAAAPESDKRPVIGKWKLQFSSLLKRCFTIKGVWQKKRLSVQDARISCLQPGAQPRSVLVFCILQNHEQTCNRNQMWRMHIEYFLNFWPRYHLKRTYLSPVIGILHPLLWGCGCWRCCCFFQAEAVKKSHSFTGKPFDLEAFLAPEAWNPSNLWHWPQNSLTTFGDVEGSRTQCFWIFFILSFCEDVGNTTVCISSTQRVLSPFERLKTFENLQLKQLKTKVPNLHFKLESEVYAICAVYEYLDYICIYIYILHRCVYVR